MSRRRIRLPPEVRKASRCPDCDSDVSPVATVRDGILLVKIGHDDSCPWYRSRGGGSEFLEMFLR